MSEQPTIAIDPRWQELCAHIRYTDDVSFKLLALVPLVSVAALTVSIVKGESKFSLLTALVSFAAAAITLALWIWERRNIQTCQWLRARAASIEAQTLATSLTAPGHFFAFPKKGPNGLGKTAAERAVYGITILVWLLMPLAAFASDPKAISSQAGQRGALAYAVAALALAIYAGRELQVEINLEPDYPEYEVLTLVAPDGREYKMVSVRW